MPKAGTHTQLVYQALRRAILEQALEPGLKLPEEVIGDEFGVSRTIVRRAFELLAADEIVEFKPNRGAFVAKPTIEEALDAFNVRIDIELLVVGHVVGKLTSAQIEKLNASVDQELISHQAGSSEYFHRASEFHILISEFSGSKLLSQYVKTLVSKSALILGLYGRPNWANCNVKEHRELIDALAGHDVAYAQNLMRQHLESLRARAFESENVRGSHGFKNILAQYSQIKP